MSQAAQPWYEDLQQPHPFIFRTRIGLDSLHSTIPRAVVKLFSHDDCLDKLVYIFNVHTKVIEGCLRGHGGEITSIAVHPRAAHIFSQTEQSSLATVT
ncbi:coatomer beta subunit [Lentinula edodes]|uniref:Coatomer beta subunit n=1 Tax=Lentinula edodes TaxID=5353 RepID=A0A1Q3EFZ3_LENED|nr:coatomer beta subunit [Lentinula edodes]